VKVDEMLDWVLPQVEVIKASNLPRGTILSRYKTPPPVKLNHSIAGFFARAVERKLVTSEVDPDFLSQHISGAMMGQHHLRDSFRSGKERDFIESMSVFLSLMVIERPCEGRIH
jgi:hypothetical protein